MGRIDPRDVRDLGVMAGSMSRRRLLALGGGGLVAATLAACGGDDEASPEGTRASTSGSATEGTAAGTSLSPASGGGEPGVDELTIGVATLQEQYPDPHRAVGGYLYPVMWSISEPLLRLDLDGSMTENLATGYEVSDDGLTWTFTLRDDVTMQDGTPFTADDVKTAVDRVFESEDFDAQFGSFKAAVTGAEVVDPTTVSIVCSTPYSNMLRDLPVPIPTAYYAEVGEEEFREKPLAAGAFKFVSQELNQSMTFERFEEYFDDSRRPNFSKLVLRIVPDESSLVAGLQSGVLDAVQGLSPSSAEGVDGSDGIRVVTFDDAAQVNLWVLDNYFPDEDSPLKDVRVRKALLMAIDRESIAESLYGGFARVPAGPTLPTMLGNDDSLEAIPYDPDGARKLLEEAGVSSLSLTFNVPLNYGSLGNSEQFAEAIAAFWTAVGVEVDLKPSDSATYLTDYRAHTLRGIAFTNSPGILYSEPGRYSTVVGSTGAYSMLQDETMDGLLAEISAAVDVAERTKLGTELSQLMYDELYGLPVILLASVWALGPNVADLETVIGSPYAGPLWYLRAR